MQNEGDVSGLWQWAHGTLNGAGIPFPFLPKEKLGLGQGCRCSVRCCRSDSGSLDSLYR